MKVEGKEEESGGKGDGKWRDQGGVVEREGRW